MLLHMIMSSLVMIFAHMAYSLTTTAMQYTNIRRLTVA